MKLKQWLVMAGLAAAVGLTSSNALAQNNGGGNGGGRGRRFGGGNFDPAQFQQRMMDNIRDQMSVTNDEEWNVIQQRIQKVFDARRDVGFGGGMRMFRGRRGNDNNDNNGGQRRGRFGNPSPEQEALQQAIDNNAPTDQVKAALDKYRAARKSKEAALEKAQSDLKAVLTPRQEAVAVLNGLLD
ncbi:MAG TPA: hypothetical protein VFM25_09350 [Verrucomicrobiae bacterium]|nr:hypothetical protein [Verrucomicrobiae bacterium]